MSAIDSSILVSLIVPAFDAEATIERTLRSALNQSVQEIEVLVVDDGSSDATAERVHLLSRSDERVRLLRTPFNQGPGAARNVGLRAARGRWIGPLDADDRLEPERLARLLTAGEAANADMVADDLLIDDQGRTHALLGTRSVVWELTPQLFIDGNAPSGDQTRSQLGFLKPLVRRQFLNQHAITYPDLYASEDFIFYIKCLAAGARWIMIPDPLYIYVLSAGSLTEQMSTPRLRDLLAEDDRLLASGELEACKILQEGLSRHRSEVKSAIMWSEWVAAVRAKRFDRALVRLFHHPALMLNLGRTIAKRLKRPATRPGRLGA